MDTTYTVISPQGDVIDTGLTAIEAMDAVLTHDGYAYSIRRDLDGGHWLWTSDGSAASTRGARHFVKSVVYTVDNDREAAEGDIARQVIAQCGGWRHSPYVMTDADYDAQQVRLAREDTEVA